MLSIQSIDVFFAFLLIIPYRKANNPMIVCGVVKSFTTFIWLCKMKLGCGSEKLKTYFGISLGLH
jgi:hypothetical protein